MITTVTDNSWPTLTNICLIRKTLDNNDLNQLGASSGFNSESKCLDGVLVSVAHKIWSRPFLLKDFHLL